MSLYFYQPLLFIKLEFKLYEPKIPQEFPCFRIYKLGELISDILLLLINAEKIIA